MPKKIRSTPTFFKLAVPSSLAACAVLAIAALPASAAPAQLTAPPTAIRSATASTPAPATAPVPSVAIRNIEVAADVGNEQIKMEDINRMIDDIVQGNPELAANTPEAKAQLKKLRDDLLDNMIMQRLMFQEAKKNPKLMPTDQEVNDAVWNFQKSFSSEVGFNRWLGDEHKTVDDLKELFRRRLAIEKLKASLVSDITVTDADMQTYYDAHKDQLTLPETVMARQIQFSFPTERDKDGNVTVKEMSAEEKKKLEQKANAVLKKAQAEGADFAVLAKQNSDDPDSKDNGGDLGTLTRSDVLDDVFAEALFNAPVGKVYPKLVETKIGYHIIKVDDKKPGRVPTQTEVSAVMKPYVLAQKAKEKIDAKVEQLKRSTTIKKYI